MTETVSNVFDLTYPSPITLEEISSIVVTVELWREEISAQLGSKHLQELDLKNNIRLRSVLPNLPSTIYTLLEKYVKTFGKSISSWQYHHRHVFDHSSSKSILSRFDNFAWDWDGTIHEVRTAKRMMLCDRLTEDEKFKIACLYCFEDDIRRTWPSVSETKDLNEIDFQTHPYQYYWICYLRNELHKISKPDDFSVDEFTFYNSYVSNRSSVMYFWHRLPYNSQTHVSRPIYIHSVEIFARFILPKLNKPVDIFGVAESVTLMQYLLMLEWTLVHVLPTWMHIRSWWDISHFSNLMIGLLREEAKASYSCSAPSHYKSVANLYSHIWESAPQQFKRPVMDVVVLHCDELFRIRNDKAWDRIRGMKFLITVLRDVAFEERNAFWHKNWRNMIFSAPVEDLVVMMKLSFRNESEITSFKENIILMYENIAEGCAWMLKHGKFKELNDFLSFYCLDELRRRDLKLRLLRSSYVGKKSVLTLKVVKNSKLLNEFIDDAFQDAADLCVEFRNQLISSPVTLNSLFECIRRSDFVELMEFVDTFFLGEQAIVSVKNRLSERFKERLIGGGVLFYVSYHVQRFLIWSLDSEDEVVRFKQSIPVEEVFRTLMQDERRRMDGRVNNDDSKPEFPGNVDRFLMWYFNEDEEEIEKFVKPFFDEFESFAPRKRRRIA